MTAERDLSEAIDERMGRLVQLARLRRESRRAVRKRLAARRTAGLRKRQAEKLARTEREA